MGYTRQFAYTERGQITGVTDPNENTTGYQYDPLQRLISVTDATGSKTSYDYDPVGNLTVVHQYRTILPETVTALQTEADSVTGTVYNQDSGETHQPTFYRYDGRNLPVAVEDALGRYNYDAVGNLVQITDKDGYTTSFDYDLNNRLTKVLYGNGRQVTFNNDPRGFITGMTDWLGTTGFELDPLGRIKKATDFADQVLQYTWTATGQKESVTYPDNSRVTYDYDQLDRLSGVTDASGGTTRYNYDEAGNLLETLLPNGAKTTYDYDTLSRITALTQQDQAGRITDSYRYGYDPAGNKTWIKNNKSDNDGQQENKQKTFVYDSLNQLIKVTEIKGDTRNYYYDTLGNRVALIEREQDKKGAQYYEYDQLNRLVKTYDQDGTLKITAMTKGAISLKSGAVTKFSIPIPSTQPVN